MYQDLQNIVQNLAYNLEFSSFFFSLLFLAFFFPSLVFFSEAKKEGKQKGAKQKGRPFFFPSLVFFSFAKKEGKQKGAKQKGRPFFFRVLISEKKENKERSKKDNKENNCPTERLGRTSLFLFFQLSYKETKLTGFGLLTLSVLSFVHLLFICKWKGTLESERPVSSQIWSTYLFCPFSLSSPP
jgi:hypothetical protein